MRQFSGRFYRCFSVFILMFYFKHATTEIKSCFISVVFQLRFNSAGIIRGAIEIHVELLTEGLAQTFQNDGSIRNSVTYREFSV